MRVVNTDNFNGDYPDESFYGPKGLTKESAQKYADKANEAHSGDYASRFWKVVADDYKLQPGFQP